MNKLKLIIFLIVIGILTTTAYMVYQANARTVSVTVNHEELEEMVYKLEMKDRDDIHKTNLNEAEYEVFKNFSLIKLEYFKDVFRLIYDYDKMNNMIVLCYKDQTIIVDLNKNVYNLNYGQNKNNNFIALKAGDLYVNVDTFMSIFDIDYKFIEKPDFLLTLDMKSDYLNDEPISINKISNDYPEKLIMTWEAVYSRNPDVSSLYEMKGLDIISPTWYDLVSNSKIKSKSSEDYIKWAREMNYDLWPAVTNSFDLDMTHALLTDIKARSEFIKTLLAIYIENDFEGINIDFENIYKEDKDSLSQFIAELTSAFHRAEKTVSMDITFAGGSDTWSKCYDRVVLGNWVDYIVVMAYDQHWGSSPISGSVASLNWVDSNLLKLIEEVDNEKIILGIPFYMRVWFERPSEEIVNYMKVTSDAITMHNMASILNNRDHNVLWDENAGQNYISYLDAKDNAVKKIWIENEESLILKVKLVEKYQLKGIASWRRGYELESIWEVLDKTLRE